MFSGITNFIFGTSSEEPVGDENHDKDTGLQTTSVDNEWLLVEKPGCDAKKNVTGSSDEATTNLNCPFSTRCSHSCNSSPTHSGPSSFGDHVGLEESWLVTPPACFTAGSPDTSMLTSHPMEDLLIEHPSMSVYGPRARRGSTGLDSEQSGSSSDETKVQPRPSTRAVTHRHPPRKPRAIANRAGLVAQVETHKAAQRVQQRHKARQVCKKKLERKNKVTHYNTRTRNLRRSEHGQKHSGRSNNRRC